jgi:hypothetical protein
VERECKINKNDGETRIWERGERKQVVDGRTGKKVQDVVRGKRHERDRIDERDMEEEGKNREGAEW